MGKTSHFHVHPNGKLALRHSVEESSIHFWGNSWKFGEFRVADLGLIAKYVDLTREHSINPIFHYFHGLFWLLIDISKGNRTNRPPPQKIYLLSLTLLGISVTNHVVCAK
jgi:hypothetical protein